MDKKGVMVEEWKARRKEWEKKEVEKQGKGKKWFWEKSFLFLFDCVFASSLFPQHPPHHHTRSHSPLTTQHDALVHTITCKQGCVLCCLFWEWTARHTLHHPHPTLHHLTSRNTHQQTQHRHSSWCKQQKMTIVKEKGLDKREKSGTTQQHKHTD